MKRGQLYDELAPNERKTKTGRLGSCRAVDKNCIAVDAGNSVLRRDRLALLERVRVVAGNRISKRKGESMIYKENPKTQGSGILCAIPHKGECPVRCEDCFFQSGRSYLEPLKDNLPNMPDVLQAANRVIRVNDGNDSNVNPVGVIADTREYPMKFYNTSIPKDIDNFDAPVVLTVNPGKWTDTDWHSLAVQNMRNLMFVRARANTWNVTLLDIIIKYYSGHEIPIVLTFMAYHNGHSIPGGHTQYYVERKRTKNTYWAITSAAWDMVMSRYKYNHWVYSCGKVEGELGTTKCSRCGNCVREYFVASEKMRAPQDE